MRNIVTVHFGSFLYGTSTPASDIDYKSVFVPSARDIILQRVKSTISNKRPKGMGEKNYAGEVDEEAHSLQRFLELASEGQTVALDVLFAPEWAMVEPPSGEWVEIMANRHRLLTRKSASFVGYVRTQANKYGVKGSRVASSRAALALLTLAMEKYGTTQKLELIGTDIQDFIVAHEHTTVITIDNPSTGRPMPHWEVCGRKMPYSASIKNAHGVMQRMVDEYGQRALMAETQQGVDWKALSHAVRVGTEALELLKTGHITFPLPNARHVLDIKTAKLPYQEVAAEIEDFLEKVEAAAAVSALPAEPDHQWIEDFVHRVYLAEVL
ncbi:nucleotidyltransferase domain-containing protein [Bradyrhizobium sp. Tv2a-2]|uniref:DNA polymerase beta superfamily protein n=1 Tax=Bradyrhizobium sp. Tv2a-2 TaxID=113395 RepID=UPI00041412CA|nr:nucleotidyltransferase domain-containing protein [Bradyrhizobium sp. Tv2a-2]